MCTGCHYVFIVFSDTLLLAVWYWIAEKRLFIDIESMVHG